MIKTNTAALRLKKGRTFKVTFNQEIDVAKLMWMGDPSKAPPSKVYPYEWKYRCKKNMMMDVILEPLNHNILITSRDQDVKIPWQQGAINFCREVHDLLLQKTGKDPADLVAKPKEVIKRSKPSGEYFKDGIAISLPLWEGFLLLKEKKRVSREELLKLGIGRVKNAEKNYINNVVKVAKDRGLHAVKTLLEISIV